MIADDVRRSVEADGPLLDPTLADMVAQVGWRRLASVGIGREHYGTERALAGDPSRRRVAASLIAIDPSVAPANIESFAGGLPTRYAELGMEESSVPSGRVEAVLAAALCELSFSRPAVATVSTLVRSIHPLRIDDPEYDVSYSDPEVPFSIFVGVHADRVEHEALRTAEAILHETMHLQLSLVEDVVPLVAGGEERWSSPWQRRPRPTQGVLHGLYVFRAVQEFLAALPIGNDPTRDEYVRRRLRTIDEDVHEAAGVVASGDLTPMGRVLAARLASRLGRSVPDSTVGSRKSRTG